MMSVFFSLNEPTKLETCETPENGFENIEEIVRFKVNRVLRRFRAALLLSGNYIR
jgi:hypothetical protein